MLFTFASSASNELTPLDSLPGETSIFKFSRPMETGNTKSLSSNSSMAVLTATFRAIFLGRYACILITTRLICWRHGNSQTNKKLSHKLSSHNNQWESSYHIMQCMFLSKINTRKQCAVTANFPFSILNWRWHHVLYKYFKYGITRRGFIQTHSKTRQEKYIIQQSAPSRFVGTRRLCSMTDTVQSA